VSNFAAIADGHTARMQQLRELFGFSIFLQEILRGP